MLTSTKRRILQILFSAIALTVCLATAGRADAAQDTGAFMAFGGNSTYSSLCLENDSGSVYIHYCCVASDGYETCPASLTNKQQWVLEPSTNRIHSYFDGFDEGCLDIYGNDPDGNMGKVDVATCNTTGAQKWHFKNGTIYNNTNNDGTTVCLDVLSGQQNDGQGLDVTTCNGTLAQDWLPLNISAHFTSVYDSTERIDVYGNNQVSGNYLDNAASNSTSAQWFSYGPNPNNTQYHWATLWSQTSSGGRSLCVDWNIYQGAQLYDCVGNNSFPQSTESYYSLTQGVANAGNGADRCLTYDPTNWITDPYYIIEDLCSVGGSTEKWTMSLVDLQQ